MSAPIVFAITAPRTYPRHTLEALPGTPWLRQPVPGKKLAPLVLPAWALGGVAACQSIDGLLALIGLSALASFCWLCLAKHRQTIQVCRQCLRGMGRGARQCPSCHEHE